MGTDRSGGRVALPAWLAFLVVPPSVGAMLVVAGFALPRLGLRPGLMLAELALAGPGVLLVFALCQAPGRALGFLPLPARPLALAALSGVALWAASLGLMQLQSVVWAPPPGYLEQFLAMHKLLRPNGPLDGLLSVAAIALAPAICEELLFRGVVLPAFLRLGDAPTAVGISAVLFGLIHVDTLANGSLTLYRVPFALCVGLGLGLLRLRAGSLVAPMLAHALLNTITLGLAAPFLDDPLTPAGPAEAVLGVALLLGGGAATALLLRALGRPPQG